jgi:hypothetical protein
MKVRRPTLHADEVLGTDRRADARDPRRAAGAAAEPQLVGVRGPLGAPRAAPTNAHEKRSMSAMATVLVALDVRARQTHPAVFDLGCGELREASAAGRAVGARRVSGGALVGVRAVWRAGPTGFGLVRAARERRDLGWVKTDRCDAGRLVRLLAAGELRSACAPLSLSSTSGISCGGRGVRGRVGLCRSRTRTRSIGGPPSEPLGRRSLFGRASGTVFRACP